MLHGGWQCHLGLDSPNDSPSSIAGGAGGGRHLCSARAARHLIRSQGDHDAPRVRRHRRVPQGAEIGPRSGRDRARDAHAHLTHAQACGGHGYLLSSGLPEFELSYLANCTLEGDNYLIGQQTTRFLFKTLDQARSAAISRDLPRSPQICRDLPRRRVAVRRSTPRARTSRMRSARRVPCARRVGPRTS